MASRAVDAIGQVRAHDQRRSRRRGRGSGRAAASAAITARSQRSRAPHSGKVQRVAMPSECRTSDRMRRPRRTRRLAARRICTPTVPCCDSMRAVRDAGDEPARDVAGAAERQRDRRRHRASATATAAPRVPRSARVRAARPPRAGVGVGLRIEDGDRRVGRLGPPRRRGPGRRPPSAPARGRRRAGPPSRRRRPSRRGAARPTAAQLKRLAAAGAARRRRARRHAGDDHRARAPRSENIENSVATGAAPRPARCPACRRWRSRRARQRSTSAMPGPRSIESTSTCGRPSGHDRRASSRPSCRMPREVGAELGDDEREPAARRPRRSPDRWPAAARCRRASPTWLGSPIGTARCGVHAVTSIG